VTFTVNNSYIASSSSIVYVAIHSYTGSQSVPIVNSETVAAGSVDVKIYNAGVVNLSDTLKITVIVF